MPLQNITLPASLNLESAFVVIFAALLIIFWINTFFILYHLIRFGIGKTPKHLAIFTLAGSLILSFSALISFIISRF